MQVFKKPTMQELLKLQRENHAARREVMHNIELQELLFTHEVNKLLDKYF